MSVWVTFWRNDTVVESRDVAAGEDVSGWESGGCLYTMEEKDLV